MINIECCNCGIIFGISDVWYKNRQIDKRIWLCPNGHEQHFIENSEMKKLEEELRKVSLSLTNTKSLCETFRSNWVYQKKSNDTLRGVITKLEKSQGRQMKTQVKIPKGWRQVPIGRNVYSGYKMWSTMKEGWILLEWRETRCPVDRDEIIIRRIKKARAKP